MIVTRETGKARGHLGQVLHTGIIHFFICRIDMDTERGVHRRDPRRALMRKDQGFVAVKIVDDVFIIRHRKIFYGIHAVVPITADQDLNGRCDLSDAADALVRDLIPAVTVVFIGNFVEKFKSDSVFIFSEAGSDIFPEFIESFLKSIAVEKSSLSKGIIERISHGLMKIQDHIQSVFSAPVDRVLDVAVAALHRISFFIFDQFVVKRKADMIHAPALDGLNVFFYDKSAVCFFCVITLRQPAA